LSNENQLMAEMFVHEATTLIEQLENRILESEASNSIDIAIDEIFRVMHTIKGNSMMMNYDGIAKTSHALEDLFDFIRSDTPENMDFNKITDLVLETVDYIKDEISRIKNNQELTRNEELVKKIKDQLNSLKFLNDDQKVTTTDHNSKIDIDIIETDMNAGFDIYKGKVNFDETAEMVNIRAFSLCNQLTKISNTLFTSPKEFEDESSDKLIREDGLELIFTTKNDEKKISKIFNNIPFTKNFNYEKISIQDLKETKEENTVSNKKLSEDKLTSVTTEQNYISVKVDKLDKLLNLVTELVVTEAMVTRNPDLDGLELDNFNKAVKQMRKVVNDLQDVVMDVRMVPLSMTFMKMNRIVRDMARKIDKKVNLELIGQNTEVDKSIIEHIADPLMHIIRNSVDHGIESPKERLKKGKNETGIVKLEAKREGGEVHIIISDDGQGLNKNKILKKAKEKDLLYKDENEYSEKEIFDFILQPGFSTNEEATDFSGRGVGMDVVAKGIEQIGGKISIESKQDKGTIITLKIPLTLAIIDAILVRIGQIKYGIPIISINQMIKAKKNDLINDPRGNEMIMYQDEVLNIERLYRGVDKDNSNVLNGILIYLESNDKKACLLADEILGEYQLVVKQLPKFIQDVKQLSGCALLGDGSICLVADPSEIV